VSFTSAQSDGSTNFFATYYDPSGAPNSASVNVDGTSHSLSLNTGSSNMVSIILALLFLLVTPIFSTTSRSLLGELLL